MATNSRARKPPVRATRTKAAARPKARSPRASAKPAPKRRSGAAPADVEAPTITEALPIPAPAPPGASRRAIFIDVENTSSETELIRVLDELDIDRTAVPTEITAVGNWRVIGQQLGRMLASRGASLVHSAPATRVRDWSDLWIAVSAGMWLGRASSGDSIDIISDDRAFDAVGDAAARLGIAYRRISCRGHAAAPAPAPVHEPRAAAAGRRRRRHRGNDRPVAHATVLPQAVSAARPSEDERHAASQAQIRAIIARLSDPEDPARGVSLDALTVALKAEGFQRPPGSPRLITRLRRLKDLEVLPHSRVRLSGDAAAIATAMFESGDEPVPAVFDDGGPEGEAPNDESEADTSDDDRQDVAPAASSEEPPARSRRRSRRRGGRRRTKQSGAHQSPGA